MKSAPLVLSSALVVLSFVTADVFAQTGDVRELGAQPPDARELAQGLFPDDACERLKAAGFKCMGLRPAVRFALPAASFRNGSADLPEAVKHQLDVFAEVLKARRGSPQNIVIEGHTDAAGDAAANVALSQRRADAVRTYLVDHGANAAELRAVGLGSSRLLNAAAPQAPENRRIEIRRDDPGSANGR